MNRFAASILAVGLIAATGSSFAQSPYSRGYVDDRNVGNDAPYYDYAQVVRVDPVLPSGYRNQNSTGQRCYREDGDYVYDDRYDDRYDGRDDGRGGYYDPRDIRGDGRDRYGDRSYGTDTGRNVATVVGGIVGAALGSKVGGGSARYATAAVGSMVGGMAGREIYESTQRNRQQRGGSVLICDPVPVSENRYGDGRDDNAVTAYDVTYEYAGHRHVTRTRYHPGDRLRIRVDIQPQ